MQAQDNMKKIMLIHGEGNLNVNPNLTGIVEILCEQGYQVHYYCPRRPGIPQSPPHAGVRFVPVENGQLRLVDKYSLVIGVDRDGIIAASMVSRQLRVPCGLITYEIFFAKEAGDSFKQPEIESCANLEFAVCQGKERSEQLSIENRIPLSRIIDIPVAGRFVRRGERNTTIHAGLGLPPEMKIALYVGSIVSNWAMTSELIANTEHWDEDWALVLHGRYHDHHLQRFIQQHKHVKRVYFTPQSGLPFDSLQTLLQAADLGIALYRPTYANAYEGNNLKYLGLSSGKISTYLQHGVPVVVNDIGEMSEQVEKHGLGIHVHELAELPARLHETDRDILSGWRENSYQYFDTRLDLQRHVGPLLDAIRASVNKS